MPASNNPSNPVPPLLPRHLDSNIRHSCATRHPLSGHPFRSTTYLAPNPRGRNPRLARSRDYREKLAKSVPCQIPPAKSRSHRSLLLDRAQLKPHPNPPQHLKPQPSNCYIHRRSYNLQSTSILPLQRTVTRMCALDPNLFSCN